MHEEIYCCNVSLPHVDTTCRLVCTDLYLSKYLFCATWLSCEAICLELKEKENVFLFFLDIVFVFVISPPPSLPPPKKIAKPLYVKGPLPSLMQSGHLFLFWNLAVVNGMLWLVNTFARLSRKKDRNNSQLWLRRDCVFPYHSSFEWMTLLLRMDSQSRLNGWQFFSNWSPVRTDTKSLQK